MHPYEIMVILDPEVDERTVQPTLEKFLSVITNGGGSVDNVDIWGRRRLSYEIQKKSEGIYAVINFTADSATTQELEASFDSTSRSCAPRFSVQTRLLLESPHRQSKPLKPQR